ncbi:cell signaling regulator [Lysinibacillus alkalisoli]|uniref:Cell signaling regulator n=1 Tax=Lysinibacillus alkalisoli TaxID=1911548 RepID=A0A917D4V5_9BACI|nr:sensor domain-containing diguanylate cyclase [Lysinibacillus alkalisoli]GGG10775.1 cell signaling regulator [Lysinibacillus alkalisoli]
MKKVEKDKIQLKYLMTGFILLGYILIVTFGLIIAQVVIKKSFLDETIEHNQTYAAKLAKTADQFLEEAQATLKYSADIIQENLTNYEELGEEATRLEKQTHYFNSTVVTTEAREVIAVSPSSIPVAGKTLDSIGARAANQAKKPFITNPYLTITDRLVVFISQPLFDNNQMYRGLVGGTLYLQNHNSFYELLGKHPYNDDSQVYVVGSNGEIIFHEDLKRIGDKIPKRMIEKISTKSQDGLKETIDGEKYVVGYSKLQQADWYIVLQRPYTLVTDPAITVVKKIAIATLPFFIVMIIITIYATLHIVRPIQKLAHYTEESLKTKNVERIKEVPSYYREAQSLKRSLVRSLSSLHSQVEFLQNQASTDALTGLMNRRTMEEVLTNWENNHYDYAVIMLDLDRFKRVNDTYGHAIGDEVLQFLARHILANTSPQDICCRYGGEEFIILLPHTPLEEAYRVAENLRQVVSSVESPTGSIVTMSAGVADMHAAAPTAKSVIKLADKALYRAKEEGRNRVYTYLTE